MKLSPAGRSLPTALFLCFAAATLSMPATAQSYADQVWAQLQSVYGMASQDGYESQNYIVGTLNEGESDAWTITLEGGYSYIVFGVCDGDCQDIDIRLYDANGNEIDSDTSDDDVPTLQGDVGTTGRFTIETEMFSCSAEPCYFGLGIFSK